MKKIFLTLIFLTIFSALLVSEDFDSEGPDIDIKNTVNEEQEASEDEEDEENNQKENSQTDETVVSEEQGYNLKLRNLEENINSLKDKIFRSKQRLAILQETVISGSIAGARAQIIHKNNVGNTFKLVSAVYYLDDAPVFKRINQPDDLEAKEITVFESSVVPGPHHISAYYVFQGKGFGIFSYMKGYTFKIKSGHSFIVEEGNLVEITVSPGDKGAANKIEERLTISFDVSKKIYEAEFDKQVEVSEK